MPDPFILKRGDPWNQDFVWHQGEPTGPVVDLTGTQAWLHLKDRSGALVADMSDYLTVDGPAGTVTVAVPRAVTREFPVGKLKFDIELSIDVPSTEDMVLDVKEDRTVLPL